MSGEAEAAGLAALSVCESLLLSLTDNGIIDAAEAKAILLDAAAAHRGAVRVDSGARMHEKAAALLEAIIENGNSVRRARPDPPADEGGPDTDVSR